MTPEQDSIGLDNLCTKKLVLGAPLEAGDTTLVPVISVTAGFAKTDASTGGGGFFLNPIAVVTVHNNVTRVHALQKYYPVEELSRAIGDLGPKEGPV